MTKLYNEVNALKSEVGELLNTYFVDPVSKTVSHIEDTLQGRNVS